MGKRITQQARGKGSLTFRVRPKAYIYKISYPPLNSSGTAKILKLIDSAAHSSPLAKAIIEKNIFYIPAAEGIYEGQNIEINIGSKNGSINMLKNILPGAKIFNIEIFPGSGGKLARSAGSFGIIADKSEKEKKVYVLLGKRKIKLNENCRAVIGVASCSGRVEKPIIKAGKRFYMMKAIGRKWHRTSAVKVNAIDHPFGGGRGKRIKSKIAKRNAPAGAKVGHIRPSRTGRTK